MKKSLKQKIGMFVLFSILVSFAVIGAFKSNDLSLLNPQNSLFINNESFEPSLSLHRIDLDDEGIQEYRIKLSGEKLNHFQTDTLVFFINKLADNAYRVELNNIIISSEGDMENGQSILKNSPNHFTFDKELIQDENELVIYTYATYKSGVETEGIYITDNEVGIKQAIKVDFFGIHLIVLGIGFLIFSAILMVFIYLTNKEREVAFLYCAVATVFFGIYFMDYLKLVYLQNTYLVYKKIYLSSLYAGAWFYILAMSKFFECRYLKYLSGLTALSFIIMSLFIDNQIIYKEFYQYWYFALLINIILGFIYSVANIKKSRQAIIFVAGFLYLSIYSSFAVLLEFFGHSFSVNSPLVYIVVFSALPLLFGFDEITSKENQLYYERILRENEFINSITDSLTGAWNQRFLYTNLQYKPKDRVIGIIDIDNFKQINDKYSHLAGDYILKEFSELAISMIRNTDDLCRYGGDEFIVILYNCSDKKALHLMEQLREKVEQHDFTFGSQLIKITISIGVYKPSKNDSFEQSLKKADQELYMSKQNGKNTVSIFEYQI